MFYRFSAAVLLWSLVTDGVQSQRVGDTICVEGFIMDDYCISDGFLLDNPSVRTLEEPEKHSVHCLVDPGVCIGSDFTILADPTTEGGLYTVAYVFDTAGKEALLQLARQEGDPANYCSSCTGGGTVQFGFRAEVTGIILDERSPPTLQVLVALPSNGREDQACLVPTEPPSMAPIPQVPTADSAGEPGPVDVPAPAPSGTSAPVILIGTPTTDAPVLSDGASGMTDAPVLSAAVPRTSAPVISAETPSPSAAASSTGDPTASPTDNPVLLPPLPGSVPNDDSASEISSAGAKRVMAISIGVILVAFVAACS